MTTYSADEFRNRAHAGEFTNRAVTVRDKSRRILASGRFVGIVLKLTGPYEHDPRLTDAQIEAGLAHILYPDYPGPHKHIPFYSFGGDVEYRFGSDQLVDVD